MPVQPTNITFPATHFSGKARAFNSMWFKSYNWLEYSVKLDACFCYPCRLFGCDGGGPISRPLKVFTITGFRSWKHATGNIWLVMILVMFTDKRLLPGISKKGVTIADQLGNARAEQIQKTGIT